MRNIEQRQKQKQRRERERERESERERDTHKETETRKMEKGTYPPPQTKGTRTEKREIHFLFI